MSVSEVGRLTDPALRLYEDLATSAGDEYRQVTYTLKAAGLKSRLGRREAAVADLEKLLDRLDPDDWLFREARRGIEQVFLRTDDLDGLATYYEDRIKQHPEDVDAMAKLAGVLGDLGRAEEARSWFEKATALAPSDVRLRRTYIESLRRAGKEKEAIAQFEALDQITPNDPDVLRDWGTVWLEEDSLPEAERKMKAMAVWKRLTAARPNDAVVTAQVADWFRQAEMSDEALDLYAKAVTLAPNDPRYLEYLGEYQHQLGRKDEAVATWKKLAAGRNRSPENLIRLAEVLAGFGYPDEAIAIYRDTGDELEFAERLRFAELLRDQELYDESLEQIAEASSLAESDEERQNALHARIETDQAAGRIEDRIAELEKRASEQPDAATALTLAMYLHAVRDTAGATTAARAAVELDPRSIAAQAMLAKLADDSGQLLVAAEAYRRLAALDRRGRTEYLKQVAGLEQRLGKSDQALATAREVLASAPGSPDAYAFYADLCFRLGRTEDGLDALRRAARFAPGDAGPTLALASALANQFRTDEAIELYWQAFDKSAPLDDRTPVVARLAELYLRQSRFDELLKRLERAGTGGDDRTTTLLVAEAHQATGDLVRACETLESLLTENPRDTQLLGRLSQLAERDHDFETALRYQREIVELVPENRQEQARLARLYLASDDVEAAPEFWNELLAADLDAVETLSLIDALLAAEKYNDALRLVDRALRDEPENWELLFRRAFGQLKQEDHQQAAEETFRRLLALDLPDDTPSAKTAAMRKRTASRASSATSANVYNPAAFPEILRRMQAASQAMALFGQLDRNRPLGGGMGMAYGMAVSRRALAWTPDDYGAARIAAFVWLAHDQSAESGETQDDARTPFHQSLRDAAMAENASKRARLDWYYATIVDRIVQQRSDHMDVGSTASTQQEAAKRLAELGDSDGAWAYLTVLPQNRSVVNTGGAMEQPEPLPEAELELMLRCFERVRHEESGYYSTHIANLVAQELDRAGRDDEARQIIQEMLAAVDNPQELSMVLNMAIQANDREMIEQILDRLEAMPPDQLANAPNMSSSLTRLMRTLWDDDRHDEAMTLFDRQMALTARRLEAAQPPTSRSSNRQITGRFGLMIWKKGGTQEQVVVDGAEMNDYVGMQEFTLLRNVYEFHNEDEKLSEFVAHLDGNTTDATGPKAALAHLSLAAVREWQEKPDEALAATRAAVEAVPGDHSLRLTLARKLQSRGDRAEALAVIDAVEPLDAMDLRDRELLALELAVALQKVDRARSAATRLFGLRLDSNQQLTLANVMQQIGMRKQADAVLARLRTQGGSAISTQIELLRHYHSQGQTETAIEIAREIVRRTRSNTQPNRRTQEDVFREEAVRLLKESGQLDTLITDARRRAERSPDSVAAQRELAEYYAAVERHEEAAAVLKAITDRKPKDFDLKYELAGRVAAMGRPSEAADLYAAAIKGKPELASNNFHEVDRVFTQAERGEDLLKLVGEMELAGNNVYYAMNTISNKLNDDKLKQPALDALDKLLRNNPDQQAQLLQQIHNQSIWEEPKIAEYALEMIKTDGAKLDWTALSRSTSISNGGKVRTLFNNIARAAAGEDKRQEFREAIDAVVTKHPDWQAGQAFLAISEAAQDQHDEARKRIRAILDDKSSPIPAQAAWSLAVELEKSAPLRDLAIEACERATESSDRSSSDFQYTPTALLVDLYAAGNRGAEARELLLTRGLEPSETRYSDPRYTASNEMRQYMGVGDKLLEMGFPIDALRVYDRYAADPRRVAAAQNQGAYVLRQLTQNREKAVEAITGDDVSDYLATALKDRPKEGAPALDLMLSLGGGTELEDLLVSSVIVTALAKLSPSAQPDQSDQTGASGTINRTHREATPPGDAASQTGGSTRMPVEADVPAIISVERRLERLQASRPDDVSVHILAALMAFQTDNVPAARDASKAVLAAVNHEAESAQAGEGQDRERSGEAPPAALGLWIVAREAVKHEQTRPLAEQLAARALAASRELSDRRWTMAMLLERGSLAFESGDREEAEAAWSQLLETILPPVKSQATEGQPPAEKSSPATDEAAGAAAGRKTSSRPCPAIGRPATVAAMLSLVLASQPAAAQPAAAPSISVSPAGASAKPAAAATDDTQDARRVVTLEQATQALELAELAARRGMTDLSIRAVRESLGDGRPIDIAEATGNLATVASTGTVFIQSSGSSSGSSNITQIEQQIADRLLQLNTAWVEQNADANVVYEALVDVVLPESRSGQVFLYRRPLTQREAETPQSAGRLLVAWAARAKRLDELGRRIETLPTDGAASLDAFVLGLIAAYETNDAPRANELLEALQQRVSGRLTEQSATLVCHGVLPGLTSRQTAPAALEVLSDVTAAFAGSSSEQPFGWLTMLIVEHELRQGRGETAEQRLDAYLGVLSRIYSRYPADYVTRRRRDVLQSIARTLGTHGRGSAALKYLEQARGLSGGGSTEGAFETSPTFISSMSRGFSSGDVATYEQLKSWMLPAEDRKNIRVWTALTPAAEPPPEFAVAADPGRTAFGVEFDPPATGMAAALVALARRHDKLDELIAEVDRLAEADVDHAAELSILAHAAAGSGAAVAARCQAIVSEFSATPVEKVDFKNDVPGLLLIAFAAATVPELRDDGEKIVQRIARISRGKGHGLHSAGRYLVAMYAAIDAGLEPGDVLLREDFGPWRVGRMPRPQDRNSARIPAVWAIRNGVARQAAGSEADPLVFRYPLSGSFDLVVDAWDGSYAESYPGFNGLSYEAAAWNKKAGTFELGHWGSGEIPFPNKRGEAYNTFRIRVRPDEVRCFVNGDEMHVDTAATAGAPFFTLNCFFSRSGWFRAARIEGDPVIPREVPLLDGDRLDGWVEYFFDETKPERPGVTAGRGIGRQNDNGQPIWNVAGGVLAGRGRLNAPFQQSWIYYHRPLWNDESIEYEFFHDGGHGVAHPALGRLAFLLEEDAVRLHWMVHEGNDGDWTGLPPNNAAEAPDSRRGPEQLPLKSGDWNHVRLAVTGGTLQITLNGVLVFERPIAGTDSRLFGLFRNAEEAVQVRNVVLRGDWPERLDDATKADLLAAVPASTDPKIAKYERAVITEEHITGPAWERLTMLAGLPADTRYERLVAGVLPSDSTPVWRLGGAFSPANPAPTVTGYGIEPLPSAPRSHVGGRIVSAARLLVETAKELDRIDDLVATIDAAPRGSGSDDRNRLALKALVAIERGDLDAATDHLEALLPLLSAVPPATDAHGRWPELIVADAALDHADLVSPALALLEELVAGQLQREAQKSVNVLWQHHARRLRGEAQALTETGLLRSELPDAPPFLHWRSVEFGRAEDRAAGAVRPLWQLRTNGEIIHRGGPHYEFLHLTTPLAGDFEIRCELQLSGWREAGVHIADIAAMPRFDRKSYNLHEYDRTRTAKPMPTPVEFDDSNPWYDYRAAIKDGTYTAWVNGVKIHEQKLETGYGPWITIAAVAQTNGGIRNFRIIGNPTVPDEVAISAAPTLSGWQSYHAGPMTGEQAYWQKRGEEIYGRKRDSGNTNEEALVYHRPMLEDGEIEYEFYYKPGETLVHPALDRLVFLLDPDGVKIHWMTDGKLDRTGLAERNETDEPEHRLGPTPLPLKPDAWNSLTLSLKGDVATVALNGQAVFKRPLESTNQRTFGLFHYIDRTNCRVRDIRMRGDWPRQLPPAGELFATAE